MPVSAASIAVALAVAVLVVSALPGAATTPMVRSLTRAAQELEEAERSLSNGATFRSPSKRWGEMMVWDAADQCVLLFGGSNGVNDTWTFANGAWAQLTPASAPSPRQYAGIAYDPQLGAVVLFGGHHAVTIGGVSVTLELNDTWTYAAGKWTNITRSVGKAPPGRESMGLAYDSSDGYLLLFGGLSQSGTPLNDTWALESEKWVELSPENSPPARSAPAMVFDAATGSVVLYGGIGQVNGAQPYYDDTWSYRAGVWSNATQAVAPTGRAWTMATYYGNGSTGYVLEFGGQANHLKTPTTAQATTYRYGTGGWTNVTPSYSPGTRFGGGMAYDPAAGYALLFGGLNATTVVAHALNDTWAYAGGVWTNLTPGARAPPSGGAGPGWSVLDSLGVLVAAGVVVALATAVLLWHRRRRVPPSSGGGSSYS